MIDAHAHVDSRAFDSDREAVLERALAVLRAVVNVGCDVPTSRRSIELAASDRRIVATVGIHPHEGARATAADLATIEELAGCAGVVAIGECGLDRGPHNHAPMDLQEALFRAQIRMALRTGLPLVIHNRDTYPDLFRILGEEAPAGETAPYRGMMHCFSGGPAEAERSLELGFHLSFSGVVTFKNAREMQEAARITPLDRITVETDCPYLTPHPHRGKRNEPAYVAHTAAFLGELLGVGVDTVEEATDRNVIELFGLEERIP